MRALRSSWSNTLASAGSPSPVRAPLTSASPCLSKVRTIRRRTTRSRSRPSQPRAGRQPSPNGGTPSVGGAYGVCISVAVGSPDFSAPISAPTSAITTIVA